MLLSLSDYVLSNQQVAWWDHSNGYAAPWPQLVRPADTPPKASQSFDSDWKNLWSPDRVFRPLFTNGGVRPTAKFPTRTKVGPRDFLLASDCEAATWGPNQTRLGVDFDRWSGSSSASVSPSRSSPNTGGATKPATTKSSKSGKLDF